MSKGAPVVLSKTYTAPWSLPATMALPLSAKTTCLGKKRVGGPVGKVRRCVPTSTSHKSNPLETLSRMTRCCLGGREAYPLSLFSATRQRRTSNLLTFCDPSFSIQAPFRCCCPACTCVWISQLRLTKPVSNSFVTYITPSYIPKTSTLSWLDVNSRELGTTCSSRMEKMGLMSPRPSYRNTWMTLFHVPTAMRASVPLPFAHPNAVISTPPTSRFSKTSTNRS